MIEKMRSRLSLLAVLCLLAGCSSEPVEEAEPALGVEEACDLWVGYSDEASLAFLRAVENMQVEGSKDLWVNRIIELADEVSMLDIGDDVVAGAVSAWADTYRSIGERFLVFDFASASNEERLAFSIVFDEIEIIEARVARACGI